MALGRSSGLALSLSLSLCARGCAAYIAASGGLAVRQRCIEARRVSYTHIYAERRRGGRDGIGLGRIFLLSRAGGGFIGSLGIIVDSSFVLFGGR